MFYNLERREQFTRAVAVQLESILYILLSRSLVPGPWVRAPACDAPLLARVPPACAAMHAGMLKLPRRARARARAAQVSPLASRNGTEASSCSHYTYTGSR